MSKEIDERIDAIHDICKRMETAIQGDEYMGVKGIKQHLEEMNNRMSIHEINDTNQFLAINEKMVNQSGNIHNKLEVLEDNQKKNKWFLAGAAAIISLLYTLAQLLF